MIRRLVSDEAEAYVQLRREALEREPYSFGSSPEEAPSVETIHETLGKPDTAIFGAFKPDLVGVVGIHRLTRKKVSHKVELWGMYVTRDHRGQGLGRQLVQAALEFARAIDGVRQVHLCVTERASRAGALYEKFGFVTWGMEPAGLRVDGEDLIDRHMVLAIRNEPVSE
jgi:RimJ/RimL family protein N-acetyltransferase